MSYVNQPAALGFLGAGNMAFAIISGLAESGGHSLNAYDIDPRRLSALSGLRVAPAASAGELLDRSDVVFLCVKPQSFTQVAGEAVRSGVPISDKLFVSIMAGIPARRIQEALGARRVIQVMPNTPLMLGQGATALCRTPEVTDEQYAFVRGVFMLLGTVADLEPAQMNAVVSVNGSSPAYVYLFVKAVMEGARRQGIDTETAKSLICQTLKGAAEMVMKSGSTPDELIRMVSSPGGTTLAALEVLDRRDISGIIIEAMEACTRRAEELSG